MPLLQFTAGVGAPLRAAAATPFSRELVRQLARDLAAKAYKAPDTRLPDNLKDLDYDRYRAIRFAPERSLWRGEGLPFELQFFHRGFFYANRVDIFQVAQGQAEPIRYDQSHFTFGDVGPPPREADLGFGGFRIHAPINRPDYFDEVCVFLGASYFRAVAKGQTYGLSARGLALNVAETSGEEFPVFKAFWIEKPAPNATSIVVHALLDSESAAAAYRFTIRPGDTTVFDTEMAIYPRVELTTAGLAPLTSMFFFGPNDRAGVDDFRPAVHDSDGVAIHNGRGEQLWRPLNNPRDLQVSMFGDLNPRGFGLIQRQRDFRAYQDLESRFEKRPSLWVEPIGDWGEGAVQLVEIPTKEEVHDNIASFWRPKAPLAAKSEHTYTYRLHWGSDIPRPIPVASVTSTLVGAKTADTRLFVVDFVGDRLKNVDAATVRGLVTADKGEIHHIVTHPNPESGGWRLSFELTPKNAPAVELRAQLIQHETMLSEVWINRWTL